MRFFTFLFAAAFLGFVWLFNAIDNNLNYETVPAKIVSMSDECHLERTSRGIVAKTRESSDWMSCQQAFSIQKNDASAHDADIIRRTDAQLSYISPADNKRYKERLRFMGASNEAGVAGVGGTIEINAHTSIPTDIQE